MIINQLRLAISHLSPQKVRDDAARAVSLTLHAPSDERYAEMERFFYAPQHTSRARRNEMSSVIHRAGAQGPAAIHIYDAGMPMETAGFIYDSADPRRVVRDILAAHPELSLALAKNIHPFRDPVAEDLLWSVSKENALFSLATAIPAIVPFLSLPWAVGEFASDTAFLTMNQIRMAFLFAAASGKPVGYREQKAEIASIVASAFGWRAIARELVGKIPMGGGLIPKAAVAFAGTFVVGASLERYYRLGYGYTDTERKAAYSDAFERGKSVAQNLLNSYRSRQNASAQGEAAPAG